MQLDFSALSASEIYHCLVQTVLPRPVAWILTRQQNGKHNLAPFSFFAPVCSNPPTLVVSIGNKSAHLSKDTFANLKRDQSCVLHIASMEQLQPLNSSAATLPDQESEVEQLGLEVVNFGEAGLGRIKGSPVAFECCLQQVVELGEGPQHVVFLEIKRAWLDEQVAAKINGRLKVSAADLNPVARLGGTEYAALGEVVSLPRPE